MNTALQRAVEVCGTQVELAQRLGVRQSTLWHWLVRAKKGVPAEHVIAIEKATRGAVRRYDLRPDIFPAPRQRGEA